MPQAPLIGIAGRARSGKGHRRPIRRRKSALPPVPVGMSYGSKPMAAPRS